MRSHPLSPALPLLILLAALLVAPRFASAQAPAAGGDLRGQVYDSETGLAVRGAAVELLWPAEDPTPGRRDEATTDVDGNFLFRGLPAGTYQLRFSRTGYRDSELAQVAVRPGPDNRADFALPPLPRETSRQGSDIEVMVVEASAVEDILAGLDLRMESDQLLNVMGAEEFSKFAASDVADALKRVSGVNVVQGQFAIIRGLEDRYSSTLYNGAPIPSPDPDSQSVQLDLFASDIVSSVVVQKTFSPDLPSNSSGGSIDIVTHDYPSQFEVELNLGSGFEEGALGRFAALEHGSPIGEPARGIDVVETDFSGSLGGRLDLFERQIRFKGVLANEVDLRSSEGFQERREPRQAIANPPSLRRSGDLALGLLGLSGGHFDFLQSERSEQLTAYAGLGFDLDAGGAHTLDFSTFYTRKNEETVQLRENGFIPGVDFASLAQDYLDGQDITFSDFICCAAQSAWIARGLKETRGDPASKGALWFTNFSSSQSFDIERELLVYQLNGDHRITGVPGLHASWAANRAQTAQQEDNLGANLFFEPTDFTRLPTGFRAPVSELSSGNYAVPGNGVFYSAVDIAEGQWFARADAEYEDSVNRWLALEVGTGGWYERATRDVAAGYLETALVNGSTQFAIQRPALEELGRDILPSLDRSSLTGILNGFQRSQVDALREIQAWSLDARASLFEGQEVAWLDKLELLGGVRLERIRIESINDAFTGLTEFDGSPEIFPSKYLLFDRLDNPARLEVSRPPPAGTSFNDQILGIRVPVDPLTGLVDLVDRPSIEALVDGRIDESFILPSAGFVYAPIADLNLRGAYSESVARPSFRELGYYVTLRPGTDEQVIGNPQLRLSEVRSLDGRIEYTWGDFGDLAALSAFHKRIDDPIEAIVVRAQDNAEASSSSLFRTFFNNPNRAELWGLEFEGRKNLEFLGPELLEFFSVGGNLTYIHARVARSEVERRRAQPLFTLPAGSSDSAEFSALEKKRRLFGQPEWIANADITFDQEDWGTKVTLSVFAISSVLDAAGSTALLPNGNLSAFTLDRYVDSFYQLDLTLSQTWFVEILRGDLTLKASIKNLTDSPRRFVYDTEQTTAEFAERSFRFGRDYSFSLGYSF